MFLKYQPFFIVVKENFRLVLFQQFIGNPIVLGYISIGSLFPSYFYINRVDFVIFTKAENPGHFIVF